MAYSDDLDCRIYVDTDTSPDRLLDEIAALLPDSRRTGLRTLNAPDCAVDVLRNDEFDLERRTLFPDGFLNFRYSIEFYPALTLPRGAAQYHVARVLRRLWSQGSPAVATCDYEDDLPHGGGYNSPAVPWPGETGAPARVSG